ncbi:Replication factor A protein 1 [Nowakowskiella sp. JEL0407]|nr:Replication factor A protein 1 [Nowakowskiella sp. JEL0407]
MPDQETQTERKVPPTLSPDSLDITQRASSSSSSSSSARSNDNLSPSTNPSPLQTSPISSSPPTPTPTVSDTSSADPPRSIRGILLEKSLNFFYIALFITFLSIWGFLPCDRPLSLYLLVKTIVITIKLPDKFVGNSRGAWTKMFFIRILKVWWAVADYFSVCWFIVGNIYLWNSLTCVNTNRFIYWLTFADTVFTWTVMTLSFGLLLLANILRRRQERHEAHLAALQSMGAGASRGLSPLELSRLPTFTFDEKMKNAINEELKKTPPPSVNATTATSMVANAVTNTMLMRWRSDSNLWAKKRTRVGVADSWENETQVAFSDFSLPPLNDFGLSSDDGSRPPQDVVVVPSSNTGNEKDVVEIRIEDEIERGNGESSTSYSKVGNSFHQSNLERPNLVHLDVRRTSRLMTIPKSRSLDTISVQSFNTGTQQQQQQQELIPPTMAKEKSKLSEVETNKDDEPKKLEKPIDDTCVICFETYKYGERLRQLACGHVFHKDCIDGWLSGDPQTGFGGHRTCPLCVQEAVRPEDRDVEWLESENEYYDEEVGMGRRNRGFFWRRRNNNNNNNGGGEVVEEGEAQPSTSVEEGETEMGEDRRRTFTFMRTSTDRRIFDEQQAKLEKMVGLQLSLGVVQQILSMPNPEVAVEVLGNSLSLQVLQVKKVEQQKKPDEAPTVRFRWVLSDGENTVTAVTATQVFDAANLVAKNDVINISSYVVNTVKDNARLMVVLAFEVIASGLPMIGNPLGKSGQSGSNVHGDMNATVPIPSREQQQPIQNPQFNNVNQFNGNNMNMNNQRSPAFNNQGTFNQSNKMNGNSNFQQNQFQPQQQHHAPPPHPMTSLNRGPGSPSAPLRLYTVSSLSPYQNKWIIQVRVIQKSDIRTWSNAKTNGKLFSCTLKDTSGEIKATAFNDAVDRWYDVLQLGCVYQISSASVKMGNKRYGAGDYELHLELGTTIDLVPDDGHVPGVTYNFVPLNQLMMHEKDASVDVIGVQHSSEPTTTINSKTTSRPITKKEIVLVDDTQYKVRMTLWGRQAESWEAADGSVIAFKGARVGDFKGRNLSMGTGSTCEINPALQESYRVKAWFDEYGANCEYQMYSGAGEGGVAMGGDAKPAITIQQAKEEMGLNDKADYFNCRASIIFAKQDSFFYPSCTNAGCNKKVLDDGNGQFRCEKCSITTPTPDYRYMLQINLGDHSGSLWATAFNEVAEKIIGVPAQQVAEIASQDGGPEQINRIMGEVMFKDGVFNVRAKSDMYNDEQRVRFTVNSLKNTDAITRANELISNIELYVGEIA